MSDEEDIKDVMNDELRAARGKPPVHGTTEDQRRRVRTAMLKAIQQDNEADFINCVLDLGHAPESAEYQRMMSLWSQRPRSRAKN